VRRIFAETNRQSIAGVLGCYAGTFALNGHAVDQETLASSFPAFFAAFPDARGEIEEVVAEGDRVVVRWKTTATHLGEYAGAPPTGRTVAWSGVNLYRLQGGKVVELWQTADVLGLLQQIGALPEKLEPPPPRRPRQRQPGPVLIQFEVKPKANGTSH
jgi:steroid delta-isomerase-like uncharacterized protein